MTHEYQTGQPSSSEGSAKDAARETANTAKDQASGVAHSAAESGQHLAGEAKQQAKEVGQEAARQAKDVLRQSQAELQEQVSSQHQKVAGGLRTFSDELSSMADSSSEPGLATDLARQVSSRAGAAASWLESREPADLLDEVRTLARRRPGTFLLVAAGAGLLAGRLTRGMKDVHDQENQTGTDVVPARTSAYGAAAAPGTSTYGTGPTYGAGTTSTEAGAAYAAGLGTTGTAGGYPTSGVEGSGGYGSDPYASTSGGYGTGTEGSTDAYGSQTQDTYGTGTENPPSGAGQYSTDTYGSTTYGTPADEDAGVFGGGTGQVPERADDLENNRPWSPVHGEEGQR